MRLLLDEGFPSPAWFRPESVDASVEVQSLRAFDPTLTGVSTPDWYLYLRANEANFDALVTRDWRQSGQPEELWTLTRTKLSIVTWKRPIEDPVREWGQLLAYLPEIRRMIDEHGPSVVFLPSPRLDQRNIERATDLMGELAASLGIANEQLRRTARAAVQADLHARSESNRFSSLFN